MRAHCEDEEINVFRYTVGSRSTYTGTRLGIGCQCVSVRYEEEEVNDPPSLPLVRWGLGGHVGGEEARLHVEDDIAAPRRIAHQPIDRAGNLDACRVRGVKG